METAAATDQPAPATDTIEDTTPHDDEQDPHHSQPADETVEHVPQDDPHLPDIPDHEPDKHNPTEPNDPNEPTEPTEPAEPADPNEPTEPTDPSDPAVEETHHLQQDDPVQHETTQHDHPQHHTPPVETATDSQPGHVEHIPASEGHEHATEELVEHHEEVCHGGEADEIHEHHEVVEQHPDDVKEERIVDQEQEQAVARAAQAVHAAAAAAVVADPIPRLSEHVSRDLNGGAEGRGGGEAEGDGGRSRRKSHERYHASAEQLKHLIAAFEHDPTPSAMTLSYLCDTTGMPMHNMVLWFKNRRARHKKANPGAVPSKTGRRSYVKSGIYSRGPKIRAKAEEDVNHATEGEVVTSRGRGEGGMVMNTEAEDVVGNESDMGHGVEEEGLEREEEAAKVVEIIGPKVDRADGGVKRGSEGRGEDGEHTGRVKRRKFEGVKEVFGIKNACHGWDAKECLKRCMSFFYKSVGGESHLSQVNVAMEVAKVFFEGELQNGLTLTSAMQPLETSVGVLDEIMERTIVEEEKLSSGSRVVLREFVAQVRSGTAFWIEVMDLRLGGGGEDTGE